jgi:hypothetical protein
VGLTDAAQFRRPSAHQVVRRPVTGHRAYHPMTMFDSMTFRARSKSVPVSCM